MLRVLHNIFAYGPITMLDLVQITRPLLLRVRQRLHILRTTGNILATLALLIYVLIRQAEKTGILGCGLRDRPSSSNTLGMVVVGQK